MHPQVEIDRYGTVKSEKSSSDLLSLLVQFKLFFLHQVCVENDDRGELWICFLV